MCKQGKKNSSSIIVMLLLTTVLIMGLMLPAGGAPAKFSDVPSGKWYTDAVQYCSGKGYVSGYEDHTFRPGNKLTRAEMAAIMNKMLNLSEGADNSFTDVPSGKWFTTPILRCVKAGMMTGYSGTLFGTTDTLTSEQGAVIRAKAFGIAKESGRTGFADDSSISKWAVGSVKAMAAKGLISGTGNNQFSPKTPLTRAQMCQIIYAARDQEANSENVRTGEVINIRVDDETPPSKDADQKDSSSGDKTEEGDQKDDANPSQGGEGKTDETPGDKEKPKDSEKGKAALEHYFDQQKSAIGAKRIDVDGDGCDEWIILGETGSGNDQIVTYHDGNLSVLPLNGSGLGYVPGENAVMVAEYEDGIYYVSIWEIRDGKWKRLIRGSFSDPEGGPAQDEDGNDIYVNYHMEDEDVTEVEFYAILDTYVDFEKMEEVRSE